VDGDQIPDLAIGRFPVRTSAELEAIINKTLLYAGKDYARTAIFAAGKRDVDSFSDHSDSFIASGFDGWALDRAYLDLMSVPDAKAALIAALNDGVALASFVGHSDATNWTFDPLFTAANAAALTNYDRPTVVTQYGCWNTYFVEPSYNTLAHRFLLSGNQGAAAVLGASTLTKSTSEAALGDLVMPRIVTPGMTMGDAILQAKHQLAATRPDLPDVLLGWTLLGDPTLIIEP
jgi:hypothetical protein